MSEIKDSLIATCTTKILLKGGSKKSPTPRVQSRKYLLTNYVQTIKTIFANRHDFFGEKKLIFGINIRYGSFFYLNFVLPKTQRARCLACPPFRGSYPE
jgi:hypothetical protein